MRNGKITTIVATAKAMYCVQLIIAMITTWPQAVYESRNDKEGLVWPREFARAFSTAYWRAFIDNVFKTSDLSIDETQDLAKRLGLDSWMASWDMIKERGQ